MNPKKPVPHVVVLGGGFGGLAVCKALKRSRCRITLIDRQNHHLFQPLLYQVATAGLSAPDIAKPIRSLFNKQKNVTVILDEAIRIDSDSKQVVLRDQDPIFYDYLVMAVGARTNYYGNDRWEKHAPGLKTIDDARRIRHDLLMSFEKAERSQIAKERKDLMRTVIVGGGPTGVELAGSVAELATRTFENDFRNVEPNQAEIILLEHSDRILGAFSEELAASATAQLKELGVEVRTNQNILDVRESSIVLEDDEIPAGLILWGAGVRGTALNETLGVDLDGNARIKVAPDCSVPGADGVFAIGDAAHLIDDKGVLVPGVSPAAMQMGKYTARQLKRRFKDKDSNKPFQYLDKGSMATVGRKRAVADIRGWESKGLFAWLLWLSVHLVFLVGFQKKLFVLIQWIYSYATFGRGSRLITGQDRYFAYRDREKPGASLQGAEMRTRPETANALAEMKLESAR